MSASQKMFALGGLCRRALDVKNAWRVSGMRQATLRMKHLKGNAFRAKRELTKIRVHKHSVFRAPQGSIKTYPPSTNASLVLSSRSKTHQGRLTATHVLFPSMKKRGKRNAKLQSMNLKRKMGRLVKHPQVVLQMEYSCVQCCGIKIEGFFQVRRHCKRPGWQS
jgi:hypothetical protein